MKRSFLVLFSLVVIFSLSFPDPGFSQGSKSQNVGGRRDKLRVVTYNVWYGLDGHGLFKMGEYETKARREKRLKLLIAGLKRLKPDVIFLQEVNPVDWVTDRIKKALGYDAIFQLYNGGIKFFWLGIPTNLSMGLTILAKKDLHLRSRGAGQISGPWGLYWPAFCFHLSEARFILSGSIMVNGEEVYLFNTHTHASLPRHRRVFEEIDKWVKEGKIKAKDAPKLKEEVKKDWARRDKELEAIGDFIVKKASGKPFILGGDFNTTMFSDSMKKLVERLNLTDAFRTANPNDNGYTWDPINNPNTKNDASFSFVNGDKKTGVDLLSAIYDRTVPRRIDYIFLGGGLGVSNVDSSRIIFNTPVEGLFPSDHYGVMATLRF